MSVRRWCHDRGITLALMAMSLAFLAGELFTGHSLGLALVALFVASFIGHALGGFADYAADRAAHHRPPPSFAAFLGSSRSWFQSLQNWQSEFLAIASMVWLAVYLRERGSPQSKPVHAPHDETGH